MVLTYCYQLTEGGYADKSLHFTCSNFPTHTNIRCVETPNVAQERGECWYTYILFHTYQHQKEVNMTPSPQVNHFLFLQVNPNFCSLLQSTEKQGNICLIFCSNQEGNMITLCTHRSEVKLPDSAHLVIFTVSYICIVHPDLTVG